MSNSDNHASASRRPSLIDAAPSTPADPRLSAEPTRVLADLGGHKPAGIPGGMITIGGCIVALAVGAGFWATSGQKTTVPAVVPQAMVAPAPAPVPAPASPPPPAMSAIEALNLPGAASRKSEAEPPTARPAGARIVSDESAAGAATGTAASRIAAPRAAVPKAAASRTVVAKAASSPASKTVPGKPHGVAPGRTAQQQATEKNARPAAHAVAARDNAHAPGRPGSTVVARARNDKRREAPAAPEAARKHADPDTDLLAAMLRRNGGNAQ